MARRRHQGRGAGCRWSGAVHVSVQRGAVGRPQYGHPRGDRRARLLSGCGRCVDAGQARHPGRIHGSESANRFGVCRLRKSSTKAGVQCRSLLSTSRFYSEIIAGSPIDHAFQKLLRENFIPTSTVMVRRRCFETDRTVRSGAQRTGRSRYVVPHRRVLSNRVHSQNAGPEARGSLECFARRRDHASIPHPALERSPATFFRTSRRYER